MSCFTILFAVYARVVSTHIRYSFSFVLLITCFFRALSLFATPTLSDDYHRFLWDGYLWLNDINPYDYKPSEIFTSAKLSAPRVQQLYANMNSPNYYSLYPPVLQAVFYISAWFDSQLDAGLFVLRVLIITAELVTIYVMEKMLTLLNKPSGLVMLYALNPLVIIELSGNLHAEAFVICFLSVSIYFLLQHKQLILMALFFSLAVLTKLTPLILLPLFVSRLGVKKAAVFLTTFVAFSLLLSIPYFNENRLAHFMESFRLYQSVFEFNAGVYYLIRSIGTYIVGYNPIHFVGPILAAFSAALILTISITKNVLSNTNFLRRAMICYLIYLFTATTVHPWYLALPVFIATFVGNITPLVWSFLVLLSYSAYIGTVYKEQSSLLIIEYVIVFFTFIASEIKGIPFFKPDNETAE